MSQRPELLTIAPEVRNMIYHEVAQSIQKVKIKIDGKTRKTRASHPLLQVCRQLRTEANPVLASIGRKVASQLFVQLDGFDLEKLSQLADDIQAARIGVTQTSDNSVSATSSAMPKPQLHLAFRLRDRTQKSATETVNQWLHHMVPDLGTKSPFRYAHVFDRAELSFDFHFRTKEMTPAQKRQTVTHKQIHITLRALHIGAETAEKGFKRSWRDTEVAESRRLWCALDRRYWGYKHCGHQ